ncbi:unnamed protein product (macronuclear) [Paramecium tetraurelia]|uniref:Transmembrane protein n=1 Tax=Paramecium tetraurelia TaxID=5888 RepID=A0DV47_PARTE|nr:uncharacterized protein GSPATT00020576001 [Paramecium tetraurelia]CAK86914.1 unnamed protein product [Paramecium tetraurelia]|eukprot:XP_001454311.1 hypothetical protein (macronuclear) [Paramecium tetraurelia strain d4-2]
MILVNALMTKLLTKYLEYDDKAYTLPEKFTNILFMVSSLLNMSYIYYENHSSWLYILALIARPSIIIQIPDFYIFGILFVLLHSFYIFKPNLIGGSIVSLINSLMKVGLMNFVFEQFNDIQGQIIGGIILFFYIFEILFVQGTLNIETKNFQRTEITLFYVLQTIMNILLMILYKLQYHLRIIQILAIMNSAISGLDLIMLKNQRNSSLRLVMISIQLITLYVGIIQFIHYENSFSLIIIPFVLRIVTTFKLSDYIFCDDQIINASILLQQRKFYECFLILNKVKDDQFVRQLKRNLLLKKCVNQINSDFQITSQAQQSFGLAQKLIQNDIKNIIILNDIKKLLLQKIQLLQNWKTNKFQQLYTYIESLLKLKHLIDNYYLKEPNNIVQALICFFYVEILNDFLEANDIIIHAKKSTELCYTEYVPNKNMFYVVTKYENQELQMSKVSSNAPSYVCNRQLADLIPNGIKEWHDKIVNEFIKIGKSKYIRQQNENYINHGQFIDSVDFAIDITYSNELNFISLITQIPQEHLTIIVNDKYLITNITNKVSQTSKYQDFFQKGMQITQIFPNLQDIKSSCFLENVQINQSKLQSSLFDLQEDISYFCSLNINLKMIENKMIYMIIQLENLSKTQQNILSSTKKEIKTFESKSSQCFSVADEGDPLLQANIISEEIVGRTLLIQSKLFNQENIQNEIQCDNFQLQLVSPQTEPDNNPLIVQDKKNSKIQSIKSMPIVGNDRIHKKILDLKKDELFDREDKSQVSSIKMLRNSKFFRKYDLYNKFNKHTPMKRYHQLVIFLFLLCLIVQGFFVIIHLTSLNLVAFADDIHLLEIKNLFFQPLDMFVVTRWNLWTYNVQKTNGIITQEEYNTVSKFATSNLGLGFDSLNGNLKSVLNRQELQSLLQSKYIESYAYLDSYKSEKYNMTLRTAISVLLSFQYILKMNYVYEKQAKPDSPQVFYSFKNYPTLRDIMTQLNQDIMTETLNRGENFQDELKTLFLLEQIFLILIVMINFFVRTLINKKLMLFLQLSQYYDEDAIQKEIQKSKLLLDQLLDDNSYIFNYNLQLDEKEEKLINNKVDQGNRMFKCQRKKKIPIQRFLLVSVLLYAFVTLNSIINFIEYSEYLDKYPKTSLFKKQIGDLGGDIPLMFAQREVLYGRQNYIYLDAAYFDKMWFYINESLANTLKYTSQEFDFSNMLVTDSFTEFYDSVQIGDLCTFLPDYLKEKSKDLCPTIMNQNMKYGLKAILVYIENLIQVDMAINNFTYRAVPTQNELEGAFMISNIINVINSNFYNDLIQLTTDLVNQQKIFNIFYLILLTLIMIIVITFFKQKLFENSQIIIHFVYLVPSQTLFIDDTFERTMRTLINF